PLWGMRIVSNRELRRRVDDDSAWRRALTVEKCVCRRPRLHGADLPANLLSRLRPVDQPVLFLQLWRLGHLRLVLRNTGDRPSMQSVECVECKPRAQGRQSCLEIAGRFFWQNVDRLLSQHLTRIEPRGHTDNCHTGLGFAMVNGPGNWGGPSIFGQKRSVNI